MHNLFVLLKVIISSEAPRLHGLRLASAANSTCEKWGIELSKRKTRMGL